MQNIVVGRYHAPDGFIGWIEPEDRTWIMFIGDDHAPLVFLDRDPATGAVL